MSTRQKLNELKEKWGLKTDKELSEKLNTTKNNVDSWIKRDKVPDTWEKIIKYITEIDELKLNNETASLFNQLTDDEKRMFKSEMENRILKRKMEEK